MTLKNNNHSMHSATSQRLQSWMQETLKFPRSSTWSRSGNARCVLTTAVQESIYCVCGRLMTKDSAQNRKYISAILDTFSIPNFYIRKNRPHGHRYGKSQGCKEYFTANQLAKKCRKKEIRQHPRQIHPRQNFQEGND